MQTSKPNLKLHPLMLISFITLLLAGCGSGEQQGTPALVTSTDIAEQCGQEYNDMVWTGGKVQMDKDLTTAIENAHKKVRDLNYVRNKIPNAEFMRLVETAHRLPVLNSRQQLLDSITERNRPISNRYSKSDGYHWVINEDGFYELSVFYRGNCMLEIEVSYEPDGRNYKFLFSRTVRDPDWR